MPDAAPQPDRVDMRFPLKPVAVFFLLLIPAYLLVYQGIEGSRKADGPWELTFSVDSNQVPALQIQQKDLGIDSIWLHFPDERATNAPSEIQVTLNRPQTDIPFGLRIYEDLMFLPGVETLDLFGHEIEIAPRVLVVNRRELPWTNQARFELRSSEKLAPGNRVPRKR